jgi:hypothetical protein
MIKPVVLLFVYPSIDVMVWEEASWSIDYPYRTSELSCSVGGIELDHDLDHDFSLCRTRSRHHQLHLNNTVTQHHGVVIVGTRKPKPEKDITTPHCMM